VWGAQNAIFILHRGQWNRARDLRAGAASSIDDLARGLIQDAIVVRFQPDANSFFSNHVRTLSHISRLSGRKELAASCRPRGYLIAEGRFQNAEVIQVRILHSDF
jgi:hypothetical protein